MPQQVQQCKPEVEQQEEQRSHIMPSYRIGDIYAPRVSDCYTQAR